MEDRGRRGLSGLRVREERGELAVLGSGQGEGVFQGDRIVYAYSP